MTNYTEQEREVSILIVEDNLEHAILAREALGNHDDWKIDVTASLSEALAAISRKNFDIILLDYLLPDGPGFDLLDWLKWNSAVVMMTSQGSEQVAVQSFRAGAVNYVVKDCLFSYNLRNAVEEVVNNMELAESRHRN